jgi:uncharacterized protein YjbJ (UPF0337 family)
LRFTPPRGEEPATPNQEIEMYWEHIEDNWKQTKADVRTRWGKLTEDDLEQIAGKRENLIGRLREIYGLSKQRAEAELRDWERHQAPIDLVAPAE